MIWNRFVLDRRIRQQTLQLASSLSRWCQVREDLLFAFTKSLESGLAEPMSRVVGDFLTRARGGMDLEEALDLLQHSLDHEHFQDLVLAVRFNFRHRGDLPALLEHLEWQLNRLEEEYVRRRLSNARDRNITGLLLLAVPLLYVWRLAAQPAVGQILWQDPVGRILSGLALLAYLAALSALLLIQKKIGR